MVARRYEVYVRVARKISHEWVQQRDIDEILMQFEILTLFEDFWPLSKDFQKFFKTCLKVTPTLPTIFHKFSEITKDCRRLLRRTQRCFNHTPTDLSTISETNLISVKSSISSLVRIWKIHHPSLACGFIRILQVVYFPVKQSCL